ncbi:MAG: oligosaccharide flippase family protein [Bacteroidetes bacterium]|nr:oligosaccharide flippase family protein [Bacteroidota bacterium]
MFNNYFNVALSQLLRPFIQTIFLLLFANVLSSEVFGQISYAISLINIFLVVKDLGLSSAFIQNTDNSVNRSAILVFVIILSVLWIAFAILFGIIGQYYFNIDNLLLTLVFISPVILFSNIQLVLQAFHDKEYDFKYVAKSDVISIIIVFSISGLLTYFGKYYLSYILLFILPPLFSSILLYSQLRVKIIFSTNIGSLKSLYKFAKYFSLYNLVNYFYRNFDILLIGAVYGTTQLGIYAISLKIILLPVQTLSSIVHRVLFPRYSKIENKQDVYLNYVKMLNKIIRITTPIFLIVYLLSDSIFGFIIPNKWESMYPFVQLLIPIGFIQFINSFNGLILMSSGKTKIMFLWSIFETFIISTGFYFGSFYSLQILLKIYLLLNILMFIPDIIIVSYSFNKSNIQLLKSVLMYPGVIIFVSFIIFILLTEYNIDHVIPLVIFSFGLFLFNIYPIWQKNEYNN